MESEAAASRFMEAVGPPLESGDLCAVMEVLRQGWSPASLAGLLSSRQPEASAAAARCLGLIGSSVDCPQLCELLGHAEPQVSRAAEEALWQIWMRDGSLAARGRLFQAIRHVQAGKLAAALELLEALLADEPTYAEAHHERGVVLCLLERYEAAGEAFERALALNPHHFAAAAGLGHAQLERGAARGALEAYRLALRINPGLAELRAAVRQIEAALDKRDVA